MKLTYDRRTGVAYLHLRSDDDDVGTVSSKPVTPPGASDLDDCVVLDFDADGHLVGIEFLRPELRLLQGVLASADPHRP